MMRLTPLLLLAFATSAEAIVIRDDVDDAQYRVEASELPALADLPGEGHGVLVAPQWVVTAAHAISWQDSIDAVVIAGTPRRVERIVVHPGYRKLPQALVDQALASGDATLVAVALADSDDIALLHLAEPVTDVAPAVIERADLAPGRLVKFVGKGGTGTGTRGQDPHGSHRTELRRAYNAVSSANARWFCTVFDAPPAALPLEGITGNGDSGSAVLAQVGEQWRLVGLPSWKLAGGDARKAPSGVYGQVSCNVRLGQYGDWIDGVLAEAR
jgi:hypothetical protein